MLSAQGMSIPSYDDITNQIIARIQSRMGENTRTDANSTLGIFLRNQAWFWEIIYEEIEDVYYSAFIDSATGASLDRLATNYGLSRNPATNAQVNLQFTGTPGFVIPEQTEFQTEDGTLFELTEDVTLVDDGTGNNNGKGSGLSVSEDTDTSVNVLANTIVDQAEPLEDITSVNNAEPASGGADIETDTSLRNRIHLSNNATPGPPINGLYTALYDVPGVKQVEIVENSSDKPDAANNPPKSLHFYVLGGAETAIAQAILKAKGAGIETVGKDSGTATDIGGHPHTYNFDYATQVPIYCKLKLTTDNTFDVVNGVSDVQQQISNYINSLKMGDIVRFSKLYQYIYAEQGVQLAELQIGRDKTALGDSDIKLAAYESAAVTADTMEVTTDGQ